MVDSLFYPIDHPTKNKKKVKSDNFLYILLLSNTSSLITGLLVLIAINNTIAVPIFLLRYDVG